MLIRFDENIVINTDKINVICKGDDFGKTYINCDNYQHPYVVYRSYEEVLGILSIYGIELKGVPENLDEYVNNHEVEKQNDGLTTQQYAKLQRWVNELNGLLGQDDFDRISAIFRNAVAREEEAQKDMKRGENDG